jgi:hypothetical protein
MKQERTGERPKRPNAKHCQLRVHAPQQVVKRRSIVIVKRAHGPPMLKRSTRDL